MATKLKTRASKLYEQDFVRWTEDQAAALRAGRLDALDLENLAEEIESLGGRDRRELKSRIVVLLMHLLKWRHQTERRTGSWESAIRTQRHEIAQILQQSPSLRREVGPAAADGYPTARRNAAAETGLALDILPDACPFSEEQVLADEWWPSGTGA